jgi:hypothetical protein
VSRGADASGKNIVMSKINGAENVVLSTGRVAMQRNLLRVSVVTALVAIAAPTSAYDSYYNSPLFYTHMSNNSLQMHSITMNSIGERAKTEYERNRSRGTSAAESQSRSGDISTQFARAKLPYQRDMKQSEQIRESLLRDLRAIATEQDIAGVRRLMQQTDMVDMYASMMNNVGLDASRMDDIMAYWYGQMWMVMNRASPPTPRQYRAISMQVFQSINGSEHWRSMSDRQKQALAEGIIYPSIIQQARFRGYVKSSNRPGLDKMADAARAGLQKSQLQIQDMRLTDAGFVR